MIALWQGPPLKQSPHPIASNDGRPNPKPHQRKTIAIASVLRRLRKLQLPSKHPARERRGVEGHP